jgi:hypothetical protein
LEIRFHGLGYFAFFDPKVHVQMRLESWLKDTANPTTYMESIFGGSALNITSDTTFIHNDMNLGATPGELKAWGYHITHVPSVDDRIRQCLPLTFGEQIRCFAELDQVLTKEVVPWVPLISEVSGRLTSDRVSRFNFDPFIAIPLPALDRVVLRPDTKPAPLPHHAHPVPPIPNGVYRYRHSRADILRFDTKAERAGIPENTGTFTVYLRDGQFESVQRANHPINNAITAGIYEGDAHHVTFQIQQPADNALTIPEATWRFDGHALHFKLLRCRGLTDPSGRFCKDVRAVYEAHPWVRVADLP